MKARAHDEVVNDQFGPQAAAYVSSLVHAEGEDLERLEAAAAARRPGRALDLGCGGGHASYRIAPHAGTVIACDLSGAMLDAVTAEAERRGLANIMTAKAAAERLPWPDKSFDLVTSRFSAHHWGDLAGGLGEMRRVLAAGGTMVLIDVVAPEAPLLDTWLQTMELLRDPSHVRDYRVSEWRRLIREAGLKEAALERFRLRLDFASWIQRIRTPPVHVAALMSLRRAAGAEVISHFELEPDGSFTIDTVMITVVGEET